MALFYYLLGDITKTIKVISLQSNVMTLDFNCWYHLIDSKVISIFIILVYSKMALFYYLLGDIYQDHQGDIT